MKVQTSILWGVVVTIVGFFACTRTVPQPKKPQAALRDFVEQFKPVVVVKMHLFPAIDIAADTSYPYRGEPITQEQLTLLDDTLRHYFDSGGLWACYQVQDGLIILRTEGQDRHSKLIVARANQDTGKIEHVADVAWYECDEQGCDHQEAWLADLDLDNHLELILRHVQTDKKGQVIADEYAVLTQKGDAHFQPGLEHLLVKDNYKLSM